jgi:periplasmic divalent cation tolerance protein
MSKVHILLSTVDSAQTAKGIASTLVDEHLAACVNIVPGVSSCYRWQGEIQNEQEFLLILKTSTDRLQDLMDRLESIHPYEVPEIISIPSDRAHAAYVNWVLGETRG